MAFNIPGLPFKLTSQDMGGFDLGKAIQSGLQNYNTFQEARFKPKNLAEDLLAKQLQNKINQPKADYAKDITLADLAHTRAGTQGLLDEHGMRGLRQQLLQQQVNQAKYEQDLNQSLFGGGQQSNQGGMPSPGGQSEQTGASSIPSLRSNIESGMQQNAQPEPDVVNPGNPNLYHLDEIYNSDPRAKQYLDKKGFKQTQTTKYDPKTGVTSVITTSPSGKVTVSASGIKSTNGYSPLTNSTRTKLQLRKQAKPQLRDDIKQLIKAPSPVAPPLPYGLGNIYRADSRATHHSLVNAAKDTYVLAKGLNVTDKALETGEHVLDRGPNETDTAYRKRLQELYDSLKNDEKYTNEALDKGISTNSKNQAPSKNNDPLGIR